MLPFSGGWRWQSSLVISLQTFPSLLPWKLLSIQSNPLVLTPHWNRTRKLTQLLSHNHTKHTKTEPTYSQKSISVLYQQLNLWWKINSITCKLHIKTHEICTTPSYLFNTPSCPVRKQISEPNKIIWRKPKPHSRNSTKIDRCCVYLHTTKSSHCEPQSTSPTILNTIIFRKHTICSQINQKRTPSTSTKRQPSEINLHRDIVTIPNCNNPDINHNHEWLSCQHQKPSPVVVEPLADPLWHLPTLMLVSVTQPW